MTNDNIIRMVAVFESSVQAKLMPTHVNEEQILHSNLCILQTKWWCVSGVSFVILKENLTTASNMPQQM